MHHFKIHSPVEEIFIPLLSEKNIRLFLKRDDIIHPFISGNKWRKLKYNLIKAEQEEKTHLVTFGGAWSNHLLATACAAASYGFKSTAFVRGEDVNNQALFLCRMFGMELRFTDRESYRDKRSLFDHHFGNDPQAFFIDEGGAGTEAAKGCAELIEELDRPFSHIFCAAGTGTTAAGIINGTASRQPDALVHVIPVLKGAGFLKDEINKLSLTKQESHSDYRPNYHLHLDYHFGGYAKTTPDLLAFIQEFSASTGILLDPVYTGKMMYALLDLIGQDRFSPGTEILAIHTGGLFGLLGMQDKFGITSSSF